MIAGCGGTVPVVAAVDVGLVAGPHDDVAVLPALRAAVHVVQPVMERLVARGDASQYVGEATWFISHTWSNAFADTLDAVLLFFEGREDAGSAKVWLDVMVTSQHLSAGPSKPPSWWMGTFKTSIARIGGLLLVVDVWNNPTALQRAW